MIIQVQHPNCILCQQPIHTISRITQTGCSCNPSYHTECILRWNDWNPDRCPACEESVQFQYETQPYINRRRQFIVIYLLIFVIILCSVLIWYFTKLQ